MKPTTPLLALAVISIAPGITGCGGSSSWPSGDTREQQQPPTEQPPAGDYFPAAFPFSQDPLTALQEMKTIPDRIMPPELYNLLREQFIEGAIKGSVDRFDYWFNAEDRPRLCGTTNFGDLKPQPGFTVDSKDSYSIFQQDTATALALGQDENSKGSSLFRQNIRIKFDNCELPDVADPTEVAVTVSGIVNLERSWIGESAFPSSSVSMDNFKLEFQSSTSSIPSGSSLTLPDGAVYDLDGSFIETSLYGNLSTAQKNALAGSFNPGELSGDLVVSRLQDNGFAPLYAFDAPALRVIHTPSGGSGTRIHITDLAAVLSVDTFGQTPSHLYSLYIEAPYRNNSDRSAKITFGDEETPPLLLLETAAHIEGRYVAGALTDLLRERSGNTYLGCPESQFLGYSANSESPLVAALEFIDTASTINTVRIYVDKDNTATDRALSSFTTATEDVDCTPNNGPSRFFPLPGLGNVIYSDPSMLM